MKKWRKQKPKKGNKDEVMESAGVNSSSGNSPREERSWLLIASHVKRESDRSLDTGLCGLCTHLLSRLNWHFVNNTEEHTDVLIERWWPRLTFKSIGHHNWSLSFYFFRFSFSLQGKLPFVGCFTWQSQVMRVTQYDRYTIGHHQHKRLGDWCNFRNWNDRMVEELKVFIFKSVCLLFLSEKSIERMIKTKI